MGEPRFRTLIQSSLEEIKLRELARQIGVPPPSLHNYAYMGTEPRQDALTKLAAYYKVSVAYLLGADEPDELVQHIVELLRGFNQEEKRQIIEELRERLDAKQAARKGRLRVVPRNPQSDLRECEDTPPTGPHKNR